MRHVSGGVPGRDADSGSRLRVAGCRRLWVGPYPPVGFGLNFCWANSLVAAIFYFIFLNSYN